jgi:uncharacterized membrane protein YkvA (DUF1232 family)
VNYRRFSIWQRFKYIVNIPQSVKLVWHLMWDKRVPAANKGLFFIIILLYLVIPTDIIPDFIPFIGEIDDLAVIFFLVDQFITRAPANLVAEYINENEKV